MADAAVDPSNPTSHFSASFLFLPADQRTGIRRLYGFCRAVDDIADGKGTAQEKSANLDEWRREIDRCYESRPSHPVAVELSDAIRRFDLRRDWLLELIAGVRMDLEQKRFASFEELSTYCYHVASTVGLLCIQIFGLDSPRYRDYAVALGKAFQLTNILRDVGSDARLGRIYLPLEDLARFGCDEKQILEGRLDTALRRVLGLQDERAVGFYRRASGLVDASDHSKLIAAEIMTAIYSDLLRRIRKADYDVFSRRIRVSTPRRLFLALLVWAGRRAVTAP